MATDTWRAELDRHKAARERTLAIAARLSQPQMDFAPGPARWSIGEVLHHLLLADGIFRAQIEELVGLARSGRPTRITRTFADMDVAPPFVPRALLPLLDIPFTMVNMFTPAVVREYLTLNMVLPIRNPAASAPRRGGGVVELRTALGTSLANTEALFARNPDIDYHALVSHHPFMGSNSVVQLLRFVWLHEQRHQGQMGRVMEAPGFPGIIPAHRETT